MSAQATNSPAPARVLVVDDDSRYGEWLRHHLDVICPELSVSLLNRSDFERWCITFSGRDCDLVLLAAPFGSSPEDPQSHGLSLLRRLRDQPAAPGVIALAEDGNELTAVRAMQLGALDYVPKRLLTPERLSTSLRVALRRIERRVARRLASLANHAREHAENVRATQLPAAGRAEPADGSAPAANASPATNASRAVGVGASPHASASPATNPSPATNASRAVAASLAGSASPAVEAAVDAAAAPAAVAAAAAPAATEAPAPAGKEAAASAATEAPAPAGKEAAASAATEAPAPARKEAAASAATEAPSRAVTEAPAPARKQAPALWATEAPAPAGKQALAPAAAQAAAPADSASSGVLQGASVAALLGATDGRLIPGYTLRLKIGESEKAVVYLATSTERGYNVALKVSKTLRDETAGRQFLEREYTAIMAVKSPLVVEIYDYGVQGGFEYLAMEYLPRGDLKARIQRGVSERQAMHFVARIAAALQVVHAAGLVHRDLKPPNVMLRENDAVALIDFGLARSLDGTSINTRTGVLHGSPYYMSPEQAQGEQIDARSDFYSLGVICYEMLTGQKPYSGGSAMEVLQQHVSAPLPMMPPELARYQTLVTRLLAKSRDERPGSAAEIIAAATALREGAAVEPQSSAA